MQLTCDLLALCRSELLPPGAQELSQWLFRAEQKELTRFPHLQKHRGFPWGLSHLFLYTNVLVRPPPSPQQPQLTPTRRS